MFEGEGYEYEPMAEDAYAEIREKLPKLPVTGNLAEREDWVWEYAWAIKNAVVYQYDHDVEPYSPDQIKKCLIFELKKERLRLGERKMLVREYNRALGSVVYPKDWTPERVRYFVAAASETAPLPPLDRNVFRNRGGYAKCYSGLLAAIYLAGTYTDSFPFAMRQYGIQFGCNRKMVWAILKKLTRLGILVKIRQGKYVPPAPDGTHRKGRSSWYRLVDPEALLDLFLFRSEKERDEFVARYGTIKNKFISYDWGEYVITYDWLKANKLL